MATKPRNKKKIVVLCDGTWNEPDGKSPTNVVKLARCIAPQDKAGVVQSIFYDQGVGTEGKIDQFFGGAFGKGLAKNVLDGYRYLVHNYQEGDDIYLFGFSRGGYTARAIAGMVGCVGLLQKKDLAQLATAYQFYRTHPDKRGKPNFTVGSKPDIKMVGVFDTVGALGAPSHIGQKVSSRWVGFFDTTISPKVLNAFQALAIDEYRSLFKPDIWVGSTMPNQNVEQCWFRGAHSDIGGGYDNTTLSDIALNWLASAATNCGLHLTGLPVPAAVNHVQPADSMTLMYKSLGLLGKGKLNRLEELQFDPSFPPINLTVHPTAALYLAERPSYATMWRNDNLSRSNNRHAERIKVSELENRRIHLVQNNFRIDAELVDINDSFGMCVRSGQLERLPKSDFEVHLPGIKPMSLHKVWGSGANMGLH